MQSSKRKEYGRFTLLNSLFKIPTPTPIHSDSIGTLTLSLSYFSFVNKCRSNGSTLMHVKMYFLCAPPPPFPPLFKCILTAFAV